MFLISLALLISSLVLADLSGLDLSWWTVDGGGELSSNGPYSLAGTIGQADAAAMSGGSYVLQGGFLQPLGSQNTAAQRWRQYRE
jgi:hypothetical protein